MKNLLVTLAIIVSCSCSAQEIVIPKGVVYKYADSAVNNKARKLIIQEINNPSYSFDLGICFIGPGLWSRYDKIEALHNIKGGNMTIRGYKDATAKGKVTQNKEGFKLVWDQLRSEVANKEFGIRKLTPEELRYYWDEISFDIEEPLFIYDIGTHKYIIDLSKDFKLEWLEEVL